MQKCLSAVFAQADELEASKFSTESDPDDILIPYMLSKTRLVGTRQCKGYKGHVTLII